MFSKLLFTNMGFFMWTVFSPGIIFEHFLKLTFWESTVDHRYPRSIMLLSALFHEQQSSHPLVFHSFLEPSVDPWAAHCKPRLTAAQTRTTVIYQDDRSLSISSISCVDILSRSPPLKILSKKEEGRRCKGNVRTTEALTCKGAHQNQKQ